MSAHKHDGSSAHSAQGTVLGHNRLIYQVDLEWAKADPNVAPVINSHALAEGSDGLIYVVTDHPKNAFVVFKKDGTSVRAFGKGLVGGHGIEIFEKDGEEYLIHVDCGWHFEAEGWNATPKNGRVTILKTDGTIVKRLPTPYEMGIGESVETIDLPGAYAGQLFFRGDKVYTAVCWSKENGTGKWLGQSGFLIVMERETKRVLSAPGGSEPVYIDGKLQPLYQTSETFIHGHDLYVDREGAIYFGEWNADRRHPAKLTPLTGL